MTGRLLTTLRSRRRLLAGPAGLFALAIAAGSVLFITGGAAHGQAPAVSTDPADIAQGELLFDAHCESCHGFQGEGGQTGAPELVNVGPAAADFYLSTGFMPLNNPAELPQRHTPFFNPTQIGQLVAYINALPVITGSDQFGPTIPTIVPQCSTAVAPNPNPDGCVTLAEGEALYATNCAQCHHSSGSGGILSKGTVVPSLKPATTEQAAEAVRVGPKPMPPFGPDQLSDSQVSAIAHYVEYLHHPSNPGGLSISGFGPVAEGFVGVIIGFGVLWFAARMIGNRG